MTDPLATRLSRANLRMVAAIGRPGHWRVYLDWPQHHGKPLADISGKAWQVDGFTGVAGRDLRGGYVEIR